MALEKVMKKSYTISKFIIGEYYEKRVYLD